MKTRGHPARRPGRRRSPAAWPASGSWSVRRRRVRPVLHLGRRAVAAVGQAVPAVPARQGRPDRCGKGQQRERSRQAGTRTPPTRRPSGTGTVRAGSASPSRPTRSRRRAATGRASSPAAAEPRRSARSARSSLPPGHAGATRRLPARPAATRRRRAAAGRAAAARAAAAGHAAAGLAPAGAVRVLLPPQPFAAAPCPATRPHGFALAGSAPGCVARLVDIARRAAAQRGRQRLVRLPVPARDAAVFREPRPAAGQRSTSRATCRPPTEPAPLLL